MDGAWENGRGQGETAGGSSYFSSRICFSSVNLTEAQLCTEEDRAALGATREFRPLSPITQAAASEGLSQSAADLTTHLFSAGFPLDEKRNAF